MILNIKSHYAAIHKYYQNINEYYFRIKITYVLLHKFYIVSYTHMYYLPGRNGIYGDPESYPRQYNDEYTRYIQLNHVVPDVSFQYKPHV